MDLLDPYSFSHCIPSLPFLEPNGGSYQMLSSIFYDYLRWLSLEIFVKVTEWAYPIGHRAGVKGLSRKCELITLAFSETFNWKFVYAKTIFGYQNVDELQSASGFTSEMFFFLNRKTHKHILRTMHDYAERYSQKSECLIGIWNRLYEYIFQ